MAGSNPEATANSPRSPLSSPNPNPKQAWKQRSPMNVAPAAVIAVPAIADESWPALSETTARVGSKPSPKASEGPAGFSPSPITIGQPALPGSPKLNPSQGGPHQSHTKAFKPNSSSSPVASSPVPLQSTPPDSNTFKHNRGYGPNKWRANNNNNYNNNNNNNYNNNYNNNNNYNGGRRNQEYYEGMKPRGTMRPQYGRNNLPGPGAPPQHVPFMGPPQPTRPAFPGPMPFPTEMGGPPVFYYTGPPAPFVNSPIIVPQLDPQRISLLFQIDYYFSPENLCKDIFLRKQMDEQGWVPVSLIAGFNKVKLITNNVPYILETLQLSAVVEVQGDKIRRRNDWMQWLLSPEQKSTLSNPNIINNNINSTRSPSNSLSRSSTSGDLSENMQLIGPGPVIGPMDSGRVLISSDTL